MNIPTLTEEELIELFEDAFSSRMSGCRWTCVCGKTYYNGSGNWDWEPGELEALEKQKDATSLDYAPGGVTFEGNEYCNACTCWHERAKKVIAFIVRHDSRIADFLNSRRARTIAKASQVPPVTV